MKRILATLWLGLGALAVVGAAHAQDYYKGKTLRIVVGLSAGGGFDTYARTIGRHFGRHIPGNPNVIVDNMPGAGSIVMTNYLYKVAKPDGLTVGHFNGAIILGQVLGQKGIDFDARRFEYLGAAVKEDVVCGLTKASGITSIERWRAAKAPVKPGLAVRRYSTLEEARKKQVMLKIRRITNALWRGLDVAKEIEIVEGLTLGDTLLLEKGREVIGYAVCHLPPNSEAPHGSAYVKLLAIDSRHRKPEHLEALLAGVEELAAAGQLQRVVVPAYTYYWTAYQTLLERGYHVDFTMVRMKRGKQEDYEDASDLVLDDWR